MTTLLDSASYPAVRAALQAMGLDAADVPDTTLDLSIYSDAAIDDVLGILPTAESLTGSDLRHAQNAAIYFCAARVAESLPNVRSESGGGFSVNVDPIDRSRQRMRLIGFAYAELAKITGQTVNAAIDVLTPYPGMFGYAPGGAGR